MSGASLPGRPPGGGYALLTDGSTIRISQAGPEDADAVRAMHAGMSAESMYLRFFSMSPVSGEHEAQRVCRPGGADHVALIAWQGTSAVGVASYEMCGANTAEVAFAVADRMRHQGVATLLLDHLVSIARQRRVRAFTADVLPENSAMLGVFAAAGLPVSRRTEDGLVEIVIPLPGNDADVALPGYLDAVVRRESNSDVASLRHLLRPASIAVVGAGRRGDSVGGQILRNIVAGGFTGHVYPVNPHAAELAGLPCLKSACDLPPDVDVAVMAVPAGAVVEVAEQCGRRGVRSLVVVASGLGGEGPDLLATCRRHGMRLVGPNCFGIAVPGFGLDATFGSSRSLGGVAGLAVQSGGIGISLAGHLSVLGIGVSSLASLGDKYDVSGNDMLTWWAQDDQTAMAILYLESFGNPRRFARTARQVSKHLPVLTVIGGRSAAGQRAAQSHTAAAATLLLTRRALFAQAGVIVAESLGELVEAAAFLACQPCPAGPRVAIVSNAGGAGVLAADACDDHGLSLAALTERTRQRLASVLPAGASVTNPLDTTAAVSTGVYRACLEAVAADANVDTVISVTVPTAISDLAPAVTSASVTKPLCSVLLDQEQAVRLAEREAGGQIGGTRLISAVPCYAFPEAAAAALGHAVRYGAWRMRPQESVPDLPGIRSDDARALVADFLADHPAGGWLTALQARDLLDCYQIPHVVTELARSEDEALAFAAGTGGPVVLKAEVPGLVHKTDAGAVKLDLRGPADVAAAYRELAARFGGTLDGILVQPMLRGGTEVLAGVVQDPVFGPVVVFGLGGIATELLGDHSARLTPLTGADAHDLIRSTHAAALLDGYRGQPAADAAALATLLLRVSRLADDLPEIAALDLNPVIALPRGCQAADARIQVAPAEPNDPFLRQLR